MTKQPWDADRTLSLNLALELVQQQFPELAARRIAFLGSGWDNDAYLIDQNWVFRFPRRREVAATIPREVAATRAAANAVRDLRLVVPDIRYIGRPSADFPYAFTGYRLLPGVLGDSAKLSRVARRRLSRELGTFLTRVHAIDRRELDTVAFSMDDNSPAAWLAGAGEVIPDLLVWEKDDVAQYAAWAQGATCPPEYGGEPRFLHDDLSPEHVLLDPEDGSITGVFDWGDATWGDPALDFVGLPPWLGWEGTADVLAAYELPVDPGFNARLSFLSRVLALEWLHDAHRRGGDLAKHRLWVRRAFAGSGSP